MKLYTHNLTEDEKKLIAEINILKKEKNAVILVHNYQSPQILAVADYTGDSFALAVEAQKTTADIIVFCGVSFMAETAKILNPGKKVILPSIDAICPMAAMVDPDGLQHLKSQHPNAAVVAYVNTTAAVKALVDICCTSANAAKVVNSLDQSEIIFVPDKHLAAYVQTKTTKKIIPWEGYCYVHSKITLDRLKDAKNSHPNAEIISHPECPMEVLEASDYVLSTSGMIKRVQQSNSQEFIIGTECGMIEALKQVAPEKDFYTFGTICLQQKKNTLENVYEHLQNETQQVTIDQDIMDKARQSLEKMIAIGRNNEA
ncbi:quinolinate synthase NadA [Patescibacteria group bacterium]|nr:quinolinate synthase NadA [Patescibacteria group bacterium]